MLNRMTTPAGTATTASLRRQWRTRLTSMFHCEMSAPDDDKPRAAPPRVGVPILAAPMAMGPISGGKLAAAVCRAGGIGMFAAGHGQPVDMDNLRREIDLFHQEWKLISSSSSSQEMHRPVWGIGFLGHSTLNSVQGWERYESILRDYQPELIQFFAPGVVTDPRRPQGSLFTNIDLAHEVVANDNDSKDGRRRCQVFVQVGTVAEGIEALEAGADGIIAQGSEAGGHGVRREMGNGTLALSARLVRLAAMHFEKNKIEGHGFSGDNPYHQKQQLLPIPVLAAGGITDGRGLVAALSLGCDGVVMGTRLWASAEANGPEVYKQRLVDAQSGDDVIRTTVFDQIVNTYLPTPWPYPYDSLGALRNRLSDEWDGKPRHELADALSPPESSELLQQYRKATSNSTYDTNLAAINCGEGVGEIDVIDSAYDILQRVNREAVQILDNMPQLYN